MKRKASSQLPTSAGRKALRPAASPKRPQAQDPPHPSFGHAQPLRGSEGRGEGDARAFQSAERDTRGPPRRKILLVDDHPMTRMGVTTLVNGEPDLVVCCQANQVEEALAQMSQCSPDLIIADMTLPGRGGLEFIKDVNELYPNLPVLVVSMHDEMLYAERALRAGARGYLMKEAGGEKMLEAIRKVLEGQVYVSEKMSARILENVSGRKPRGSTSPIEKLSDREFEVFQLIGQGKSTKEIARQLNLSPKTVEVYRGNIKEKLELKDATSLVRQAVRWVETQKAEG